MYMLINEIPLPYYTKRRGGVIYSDLVISFVLILSIIMSVGGSMQRVATIAAVSAMHMSTPK